ncbi:uracil-DNA glycosylase family protein [Permianibacter aggregans]|uniref:Uracil-DNA glycosylase family 4 n=1 Tax=Permianibacter aggregans TaxID=1510150 RepID=A0A4R6ULU8_9GAMM|nr:uracil-DNA glycosylase family protein [Permianibacter aggregans]QGX40642.1 uracil-DNA glycosylase family protein [Permianibacter aggregans]TDQ46509.1 uracil-DNA glycosylase family 4 [Permianibacter aggregans]
MPTLKTLLAQVRACQLCAAHLPLAPKPILQAGRQARILIVGQAPGRRAHDAGKPFADISGERLRQWLDVEEQRFYDATQFAILPMGFCFPGTGRQGDLPPRPECAPAWRQALMAKLPNIELTLVIGRYAQAHYFGGKDSVTDTVRRWREYLPELLPLPHPSPRNQRWLKQNPWFDAELLPYLRQRVAAIGEK